MACYATWSTWRQTWIACLGKDLLGNSLGAYDWWWLPSGVTTTCRIDIKWTLTAEANLILDVVHEMGPLLLLLLVVILPCRFALLLYHSGFLIRSLLGFYLILVMLLHQKRLVSNESNFQVFSTFLIIQPRHWNSMRNVFLVSSPRGSIGFRFVFNGLVPCRILLTTGRMYCI